MAENANGDQDDYSYTDDGDEHLEALTSVTDSEAAALLDETETTADEADALTGETSTELTLDTESAGVEPDGNATEGVEDPELEAIKARVREMEEEAEKLKEMQSEVEKQMNLSGSSITSPGAQQTFPTIEEKLDADGRSVYVGNVDYGATAQELEAHFHGCGSINRVTILVDKFTGSPKGFAYVEFADKDSVQTAMALDESLFRGRQIKVSVKRTNRPGISSTDRAPRGRHRRARNSFYYGYAPRRGRFRPRRTSYYSPY